MTITEVRASWKKWQLVNVDKAKAIGKTFCDMAILQSWGIAKSYLASQVQEATRCTSEEAYAAATE